MRTQERRARTLATGHNARWALTDVEVVFIVVVRTVHRRWLVQFAGRRHADRFAFAVLGQGFECRVACAAVENGLKPNDVRTSQPIAQASPGLFRRKIRAFCFAARV